MKIIDYSTPDLNSRFKIHDSRFMIVELLTASLIFIIPVLALFILSK